MTYLVFYRYIVGDLAAVLEDPSEALPAVKSVLTYVTPYGFLAFNIFIDLFLCTLTMVFLNYKPRRVFTGRARILFRLLALLPIGYEVGCMLLKLRAARGLIQVPVWAYPLLTTKPPMTFVLFLALALFVKTRELPFRRHGKTHEEYHAFLKTRRNSLNFSVFLAIMLVIVSILDFVVVLGFSVNEVVLLFSYTRKPKYPMLDLAIPVAGIVAIVFVYLEGTHRLLPMLPFKKLNLKEVKDETTFYIDLLM